MKKVRSTSILLNLNFVFISLLLVSCNPAQTDTSSLLMADIRGMIDKPAILNLRDEIKEVKYIPLEATKDDASLIDGVYDYAVTSKYIYILPVKEPRIVLFDRDGHFIKTLIKEGQGPGEFSGMLTCIQADELNDRLYLYNGDRALEYTLDGDFIREHKLDHHVLYARFLKPGCLAGVSFPFQPFDSGAFGIGIFDERGNTIETKNDFHSSLVSREKCGFTISVAATYSDFQRSVLFKTGSNDTVFRISADKITPACVLNLRNSDAEVIRSLDITDFSNMRADKKKPKDIFVQEMFDTPKCYYFSLWYDQGSYIASVDKRSGETLVEKCEMPGSIKELADANLLHGMEGTRSYGNFPVWGRVIGDELVQVVTPYELSLYKTLRTVTIPAELNKEKEEGNPVFVFYSLIQPS